MTRRHIIMVALAVFLIALPLTVFAAAKATTVREALEMDKGTEASLTGFVEEKLMAEMYLFSDDTGKINLKIPNDVWKDRELEPEKEVKIHGEIDVDDDGKNYIKVDKIRLTFKEKVKDIF